MANIQALYDIREFAQDLVDNLPADMYYQDRCNFEESVSTVDPTCGCIMHHLMRVSGHYCGFCKIDEMLSIDSAYVHYIIGATRNIKEVEQRNGFPRGEIYDTKELVKRIDYVISIEEQQIKENNFGY